MLYYKNVINDEIVGYTESPAVLNVENFYEISKEEYIEIGGIPSEDRMPVEPEEPASEESEFEELLKQALLE